MKRYPVLAALGLQVCLAQVLLAGEPLRTVSGPPGEGYKISRSGGGNSYTPAFSPDGRYLVYLSEARNLVTNDTTSPCLNLYMYDIVTGSNTLVSVAQAGLGGGNENSGNFSISSNAQVVAFQTTATNIGPLSQMNRPHCYLRDTAANTTALGSVNTNGSPIPGTFPLISPNGRWLYFEASLSYYYSTPTRDVVARDLQHNTNVVLSFGVDCLCDNGSSRWSELHATTPDGRFVAFTSYTTGGDTNVSPSDRLYVRDMETGGIFWASTNIDTHFLAAGRTPPFQNVSYRDVGIDAGGRRVAFAARLSMDLHEFVFVHDMQSGTTALLSTNGGSPSMSLNGRYVAYCDWTNVMVFDTQFGTNALVSVDRTGVPANGVCKTPVISANGRKVVFLSTASLVPHTVNGQFQLYARDLIANTTEMVSVNTNSHAICTDLESIIPAVSPDGRWVAFDTAAEDLVREETLGGLFNADMNHMSDVYIRDLEARRTRLVSVAHPSFTVAQTGPGFATKSAACVSSNGQRVVFTGSDGTLIWNDNNGFSDVFVRDLALGNISRAARSDKPVGDAVISADGRYVAYTRRSGTEPYSNFGAGDIYRHDALVSVATNGSAAGWSSAPAISPDGRYVAFQSRASNLVELGGSSKVQIYMRDMLLGSNILVSANTSGGFGDNHSFQPLVFSPDGRWLMFRSLANNLLLPSAALPTPSGNGVLYVRDMLSNTVVLLSEPSYPLEQISVAYPSFSQNSRYVTYAIYLKEVWVRDLAGTNRVLAFSADFDPVRFSLPSIDNAGRFVVCERQRSYVGRDRQIILKDLLTGATNLLSANYSGTAGGNDISRSPVITPDGQFVVFASKASDLVWGDTNGVSDIFVRDLLRNVTTLVSVNAQGAPANGSSTAPVLAGDGRTVIFQSFAGDLVEGDYNMKRDLFLLKLSAGDSDGDNLDDDWEVAHFGNLERDGSGDYDADGQSDREEFLAGTDPTNTGSVLRVMMVKSLDSDTSRVLWNAAPGRVYRLQVKANLTAEWQDWPTLPTFSAGTAFVEVNNSPTNAPQLFYRTRIVP